MCGGVDVGLSEHALDDREHVGAGFDQGRAIFRCNAADRNDGNPELRSRRMQQLRRRAYRAGLGAGGKEAAEGDVVRAVLFGRERAFEFVVARHTNQFVIANQCARRAQLHVFTPEMHAVGSGFHRQGDIIVNEKGHTVAAAEVGNSPRLA